MRRVLSMAVLAALLVVLTGCSNSADKGKNKDKDVPKPGRLDNPP
jgi:hypothetical protein